MAAQQEVMATQVTELQAVMTTKIAAAALEVQRSCRAKQDLKLEAWKAVVLRCCVGGPEVMSHYAGCEA